MRFLIFNLVVGAAIFYLVADGDAARQLGLSEATVAKVGSVTEKIQSVFEGERPQVSVTKPVTAPKTPAKGLDAAVKQSMKRIQARSLEKPAPPVKTPRAALEKTAPPVVDPLPAPKKVAKAVPPPIGDAKYVATRPVKPAPKPVAPEVESRRAEVMGAKKGDRSFAVENGEALMSPAERLRELSNLADDMELVYFNSLEN